MSVANLDPKPWTVQYDDETPISGWATRREAERYALDGDKVVLNPRPEFDVRNNPLLEIFADLVAHNDGVESVAVLAERFLDHLDHYAEEASVPEQRYAEEVLERIVVASR